METNNSQETAVAIPACWQLASAVLACPTVRTALFWGPPGIGKTFSAYRDGLGTRAVYKITLTEDTPAAELRGHYIPHGTEFVWHDGPAVRAMREGARLVVDEIAHAAADVLSLFYAILESPDTARLTLPTGETVRPAPGFQCIITDNEGPAGLPQALRDRLDACIRINEPHPEALKALPESVRTLARDSAMIPDAARRISLRAWESVNRLLTGGMELETAGQVVFGERWPSVSVSLQVALRSEPDKLATV